MACPVKSCLNLNLISNLMFILSLKPASVGQASIKQFGLKKGVGYCFTFSILSLLWLKCEVYSIHLSS